MIDPAEPLATARIMLEKPADLPVSEATIRRGVSTAYYAVVHHILRTTADCFVGSSKRDQPSYAVIYRSITHRQVVEICTKLNRAQLTDTLQQQLGRQTVSSDMKNFASRFVVLQEMREVADYAPVDEAFATQDFRSVIEVAEDAMRSFDAAVADERADILAVILAGSRR